VSEARHGQALAASIELDRASQDSLAAAPPLFFLLFFSFFISYK
jgi:hypothetical protein